MLLHRLCFPSFGHDKAGHNVKFFKTFTKSVIFSPNFGITNGEKNLNNFITILYHSITSEYIKCH